MLGRAGASLTAAGRDVVGRGVGEQGRTPRQPTPASAHDRRGNDSEMGQTGATRAEAERRGGLAWSKDGLVAAPHEQRHGKAGSRGRPEAEMQSADLQSIADERGRTNSR
jgi:hypothetical protein